VFDFKDEIKDTIQACFYADLSPLSVSQFTITSSTEFDYKLSETIVYNEHNNSEPPPSNIEISSEFLKLIVNGADGMLRKIYRKQGGLFFRSNDVRLQFMSYGTRKGSNTEKSGAYLFLPDSNEAQPLLYSKPMIRVTRGLLISTLEVVIENPFKIVQKIILYDNEDFVDIQTSLLLEGKKTKDIEVILRFFTDVNNEDTFYTDLNGFQVSLSSFLSETIF